jgi:hypothetical protein
MPQTQPDFSLTQPTILDLISHLRDTLSFTAVTGYYHNIFQLCQNIFNPLNEKNAGLIWLCQPSTLSQKHKTYEQLFQIKLETHYSLTRTVTPYKKLLKAQHG